MDKLICEHCGAELTIEKKFCSECGSSNPHYVEPPMDIEENLPETLQDLFEWYQMKFGYNTYVKVNIRQNKAEPNSYCIFGYKDKFTAYQYGPTGDSLTRIVLYDGPSEKEAVRTLCKKLEVIYDEFRQNGYKKKINYTEETGIPNNPHYNYGRYDKARQFMQDNGVDVAKVDSWDIPRVPDTMTTKEYDEMLASLKKSKADRKNDKFAEFLAYVIIGIGVLIFCFFASFAR